MNTWPNYVISDGTEQPQRLPEPLEPEYFLPDERGFDELFALGLEIARALPFKDLRNKRKGTWGDLFKANEAAIMAHILSTDTARLESEFTQSLEKGIQHAARLTFETARRIDFWISALDLSRGRAAMELIERIEALVRERDALVRERLGKKLQTFVVISDVLRDKNQLPKGLDFRNLKRLCEIVGISDGGGSPTDSMATPPLPANFRVDVRGTFSSLLNVIDHLRSIVPPYLTESQKAKTHDPTIALFMVFLKLLEPARQSLNRFSEEHLKFYYEDVLKTAARPHKTDHLFLSLRTLEEQSGVQVPAGTEFLMNAGEEEGEIVFRSEQDAIVSDAAVDTLCTLRFERSSFISPETELGYVTRIKSMRRDLGRESGLDAMVTDWPLLGTSSRLAGHDIAEDARIGFAVASPVLLLREGHRQIKVEIELGDPGESSLLRFEDLLRDARENGKTPPTHQETLERIFTEYLSAEWDLPDAVEANNINEIAGQLVSHVGNTEAKQAFDGALPTRRDFVYKLFLKTQLRRARKEKPAETFRRALGELFGHYVLTTKQGLEEPPKDEPLLDEPLREEILGLARDLLDENSCDVLDRFMRRSQPLIFQTLLKDAFKIDLTVPTGWHKVDRHVMTPLSPNSQGERRGLQFLINLEPEVEPIVPYSPEIHGGQWGGTAPLIRFQQNAQATFCAYSLLGASRLTSVGIDVKVRGYRELMLYNNVGRVDPSKPFQPFGPLPTLSSYLAFGSYEMARKQLTRLKLNLEWADLPTCYGGFHTHYSAYEKTLSGDDFRAEASVLQDGSWQPQSDRPRKVVSLFASTGPTEKLKAQSQVKVEVLDFSRPIAPNIAEDQFDLQPGVRSGFFRLKLCGPEGAFGHADYPILLSKALSENIRSKASKRIRSRTQTKVPDAPYTPLLSQVSVDYAAQARIRVDEPKTTERSETDQRIFHLHPFGYEEPQPEGATRKYTLLPKYDTDGNLFIGITGGRSAHTLALLFHLTEETENQQTSIKTPDMVWYYLSPRGWQRLPASSLVSDTTNDMLCSGIVTLNLPEDADRQSTLMPSGKVWVRAGANANLDSLPRLYSVGANGIRVFRRIETAAKEKHTETLPIGSPWQTAVPVPGLGEIAQVGRLHSGEPAEDRRRFHTRVSERLRHKGRAITAWDYERLILQQFPNLFKVKCFAGMAADTTEPKPGHVLIVVVPFADGGKSRECLRPMVDVLQLDKIQQFVEGISSRFVEVEVRNPLYERIQVRCKVRFSGDANPGFYLRKLNREVSDFLCPWVSTGYSARFGWTIKCEDVEGFIREFDYVDFVTDFSMLHLIEDEPDSYTLNDTAPREALETSADNPKQTAHRSREQVRWRYPWSLAVPMERHFIEAMRDTRAIEADATGVGDLEIGATFVVCGPAKR